MKAAFQIINLEPPIGYSMAGFTERDHGAEGIHDPITGSVLLLDDGTEKAAIVSLDIIAIDSIVHAQVAKKVAAATSIRPENILISAIHTHSSVDATRINGVAAKIQKTEYSDGQIAYYHQMIDKIAGMIVSADRNLKPAKIGYGVSVCHGLGTNRNDPKGYYDPRVYLLKAETLEGELIGLLVSHGCHPTILNHHNFLFTADYVGAFRKTMSKLMNADKVMFLQGAAGSASCRYTRKESTFVQAEKLSYHLSAAVLDQWEELEMKEELSIESFWDTLTLPVKDYGSEAEILEQIADYKSRMAVLERENAHPSDIRKLYVTLQGAERNLKAMRENTLKEISAPIQILKLGPCSIAGLPGDVFGEIGRDVCDLVEGPCFAAGYANDFIGYIVSKEGYKMDCYERNLSYFDERAHDLILQKVQALLKK